MYPTERNKVLILSDDVMRGIDNVQQKYGMEMFIVTMNQIFIDSGMLPGIPIGFNPGMHQRNGIWLRGVKYVQYESWETQIDSVWKEFKIFKN